ncbi:MAG: hypothetical protein O7E52_09230 [Candidatus Poribacteria bacterium]|nr:hypothetical protein [Candidatus Poribacteria bacterium]
MADDLLDLCDYALYLPQYAMTSRLTIVNSYRSERFKLQVWMCLPLAWLALWGSAADGQMMSNLHNVFLIEKGQIYFDSGYNHGIREGMHFQIYRIDTNGQPVKLARMVVTATFDQASKGALVEEDIGVEVKIGDRVEILPIPEQTAAGVAERATRMPLSASQTGTGARARHWFTLGGGIVAGGLTLHFRSRMNDAHDKYNAAINPNDIVKFRNDTESHLWRYRIFAGVSMGLLGYSVYKLFLPPNPASTDGLPISPTLYPEFSHRHVGATFRYAF